MPLNPRLLDDLTRANERPVDSSVHEPTIGGVALAAMREFNAAVISPDAVFENPELNETFKDIIDDTAVLFERAGIAAPSLEDIMNADIDFASLERGWNALDSRNQQPQFVVAKDGLTIEEAQNVYAALWEAQRAQRQDWVGGDGLFLTECTKQAWERGMLTTVNLKDHIPRITTPKGDSWTLRIIPGSNTPRSLNADYFDRKADDDTLGVDIPHPTIGEYLTLLARRVQSDEQFINDSSLIHTWLQGIPGGIRAPVGFWYPQGGVDVNMLDRGARHLKLGARPAVW